MNEIQTILQKHQDVKYGDFIAKLVPTLPREHFIGIRSPEYKKIVKELPNGETVRDFLKTLPHEYFEENMLHSVLLCSMKNFEECLETLERFLPYVDNWAVCDGLNPKIFRNQLSEIRDRLRRWIGSDHVYTVRFGMHMLMTYFLDDLFEPELLEQPANLRSDEYYVNMMTAWLFAEALVKQWDTAIGYIREQRLDRWTHNKAIQKAIESYRITDEQKNCLRKMKV